MSRTLLTRPSGNHRMTANLTHSSPTRNANSANGFRNIAMAKDAVWLMTGILPQHKEI